MRCSIIIANYNYQDYVSAAISSALAVDWADKEIIVVDDASTDCSSIVIQRFGGRIKAFFREKSCQINAHIFGFERSTGTVILLLDADDLLEPQVMKEVARVWRPGISKVQFRMALIDTHGVQLGTAIPQFPSRDRPEWLRRNYRRTMTYITPPGSGNAYARDFVAKAYAMSPPTMRWSDDVLLTLAPIMGDIVTIRQALVRYRIHTANDGALRSLDVHKLQNRLRQDIEKVGLLSSVCPRFSSAVLPGALSRAPHHLQYRLASYLMDPVRHPFPEDKMPCLLWRLVRSLLMYSTMKLRDRFVLLLWAVSCAGSPRRLQERLIHWRFAPTSRPSIIGAMLGMFSSLRTPRLPDSF